MTTLKRAALAAGVVAAASLGCSSSDGPDADVSDLTSKSAVFLELGFGGDALVPTGEDEAQRRKRIESQMLYLSGELDKTHGAQGRFGFVELAEVIVEPVDDQLDRVRYQAKLPVAWPKDRAKPTSYRVVVPRRLDSDGLRAFNSKYAHKCAEAHYGQDNLWYDFRPVSTAGCSLDPADVVDVQASVADSPHATIGRYPELPRFWEDGVFRMVLVHGTDSAASEDPGDFIAAEYIAFKDRLREAHPDATITEGSKTDSIYNDWQLEAPIEMYGGGGKGKLVVNALLTSQLKYIGSDFDERFDALSGDADLIAYGGHSGLSLNIKALAAKGIVNAGKYQVMMLQGCSTFAYLDRSVADRRIAVNGSDVDPHGTKFLDVVATAQPAYAYTNSPSFWAVLQNLSGKDAVTYEQILEAMPQQAIPVVAGEEDNPTTAP